MMYKKIMFGLMFALGLMNTAARANVMRCQVVCENPAVLGFTFYYDISNGVSSLESVITDHKVNGAPTGIEFSIDQINSTINKNEISVISVDGNLKFYLPNLNTSRCVNRRTIHGTAIEKMITNEAQVTCTVHSSF